MPEQSYKFLQPKQYGYEPEPAQIGCRDGYGNSRAKQTYGEQCHHAKVLAKDDCGLRSPALCIQAEQQKQVIHVGRNKEHEAQAN